MEKDLRKRIRLGAYQKAALTTLAIAGTLLVAAAAPNLMSVLGKTLDFRTRSRSKSAIQKLASQGLIKFEGRGESRYMTLTARGHRFVDRSTVPRKGRWDGRWRLVIFDIPQERRAYRRELRSKLQEIGFEKLQASVWAFPYDCEELVTLLKLEYGLGKEVLYIIADSIENDRGLRARFGLKRD